MPKGQTKPEPTGWRVRRLQTKIWAENHQQPAVSYHQPILLHFAATGFSVSARSFSNSGATSFVAFNVIVC